MFSLLMFYYFPIFSYRFSGDCIFIKCKIKRFIYQLSMSNVDATNHVLNKLQLHGEAASILNNLSIKTW